MKDYLGLTVFGVSMITFVGFSAWWAVGESHDEYIPARVVHAPEAPETPPEALTGISQSSAQTGGAYVTTPDGSRLVVDSVTFSATGLQPMPTGGVKLRIVWPDSTCRAGWVKLEWNGKSDVTATNANKRDEDKCP